MGNISLIGTWSNRRLCMGSRPGRRKLEGEYAGPVRVWAELNVFANSITESTPEYSEFKLSSSFVLHDFQTYLRRKLGPGRFAHAKKAKRAPRTCSAARLDSGRRGRHVPPDTIISTIRARKPHKKMCPILDALDGLSPQRTQSLILATHQSQHLKHGIYSEAYR